MHVSRAVTVVFVVALAAVGLGAAAGSRAAGAPPIAIRQVMGRAYGHPGGSMVVAVRLKAKEPARASRLTLYLSKDRQPDERDTALDGEISVPALKAGASFAGDGIVTVPETQKPGRYFVVACPGDARSAGDGCVAAGTATRLTAAPVTTRDLVEAAVERGDIDAAEALAYRVFAAFGDPRVPAQYRGDDGMIGDDGVLAEAVHAWPGLPAKIRADIEPFFSPPAAKGSWANGGQGAAVSPAPAAPAPRCIKDPLADSEWDSLDTANGKVRIWWRKDAQAATSRARAKALAGEIDKTIWPLLSKLFAPKAPLSDARVECFKGGDGRLDVYFNRLNRVRALTVAYPPKCANVPAFLLVPPDVKPWELTHEITHAFQFAYPYKTPCDDYRWFDEGSATWAGHYVYPADDYEHDFMWLLREPWIPLGDGTYASWTFELYMEKLYGAKLIPQAYRAFAKAPSLVALNGVLPGGFDRAWPEFTRYAWNQEPLTASFRQWDGVEDVPLSEPNRPVKPVQLALGGLDKRVLRLPAELYHLSRSYKSMHVVEGENVHYLKFDNTLAGIPHVQVQAFVRFEDGTWETQDWSNRPQVEFCFDNDDERVRDIILMYSNSDHVGRSTVKPARQPTLLMRKACDTLPYYYRVIAYSFEERSAGSQESILTGCGMTSGTSDYVGELPESPSGVPTSKLEPLGDGLTGYVRFTMPANSKVSANQTREGCKRDSDGIGYVPCSASFPDFPIPTAALSGLDFFASPGDQMVRVDWPVTTSPGIGNNANPTDAGCNVGMWVNAPFEEVNFTYVPLTTLKQTTPFTLTNSGQVRLDKDPLGRAIDFTYSWSHTMTLQRVDEKGGPVE